MHGQQNNAFPFFEKVVNHFRVPNDHSLPEIFFFHIPHFNGFEGQIAEVPEKFSGNDFYFFFTFSGKWILQVFYYDSFPVPNQIINNRIKNVRKKIDKTKGEFGYLFQKKYGCSR